MLCRERSQGFCGTGAAAGEPGSLSWSGLGPAWVTSMSSQLGWAVPAQPGRSPGERPAGRNGPAAESSTCHRSPSTPVFPFTPLAAPPAHPRAPILANSGTRHPSSQWGSLGAVSSAVLTKLQTFFILPSRVGNPGSARGGNLPQDAQQEL